MDEPSNDYQIAVAHREVVERLWTEPLFGEIGDDIPLAEEGTQLVAESRCGFVALELREMLPDDVRMIALDPKRAMLDEARERAEERGIDQIFFVPERVDAISYADGVFSASVCLDGLVTARQLGVAVAELARATDAGGGVAIAAPLAESFREFYDLLEEALRARDLTERIDRIEGLRETLISPARLWAVADECRLEVEEVRTLEWPVEFEHGHEFLRSPIVRETFFPHWIGLVSSPERDNVLRHVGDAIDTYWHDRSFETKIRAGFMIARVPD